MGDAFRPDRDLEVAAATLIGRDHERVGKNNQDALGRFASERIFAAIVSDGCGSSRHAEVGSKAGSRILLEAIRRAAETSTPDAISEEGFWERARLETIDALARLADAMGGSRSRTVSDYFLFTALVAAVTPTRAVVAAIGDGVIYVNGTKIPLGPFPGNAPPYVAYGGLAASDLSDDPDLAKFRILADLPTARLDSILLGTDGAGDLERAAGEKMPGRDDLVGPLSQFWEEEKYFANPDMLRRKLFLANRKPGFLRDDTTIVALRRRRAPRPPAESAPAVVVA